MEEFTIGLALYDFVPVALTGIAVYFIAQLVRMSRVPGAGYAVAGALLVVAAGLSKAVWKLNATINGVDVTWLANALFPLMAPGFTLLAAGAWGVWRHARGKTVSRRLWLVPLALIAVTYAFALYQAQVAGVERGWFPPIMNLASLANIGLTVLLFLIAWHQQQRAIAFLLFFNLAMVFALIPIAQMETQSIAIHWFEQTLTAIGAGTFAYANFRIYREAAETVPAVGDRDNMLSTPAARTA